MLPVAVAGFANAPLETVNKVASIDAGAGVPQNAWSTLNRFDYTYGPQASPCISVPADYSESDFAGTNSLSPYAGFDTGTTIFNQSYLYNLDVVVSNAFLANSKVSYSRQNTNQPINGAPTPSLYLNQANTASTDGTTGTFIAFPGYLPTSPGQRASLRRSVQRLPVCAELHLTKGKHTFTFGGEFFQLARQSRLRCLGGSESSWSAKTAPTIATALECIAGWQHLLLRGSRQPAREIALLPTAQAGVLDLTLRPAHSRCRLTSPNFERENTFNDGNWYVDRTAGKPPRTSFLPAGCAGSTTACSTTTIQPWNPTYFLGTGATLPAQIASGQVLTTPNSPVGGLIAKQLKNYAPRIGAAWDVFGDGKWSVRSGFGISYERNFGNVTYNVIQNPPNYAGVTLTSGGGTQYTLQTSNFGPFAGASGSLSLWHPLRCALCNRTCPPRTPKIGCSP